MSAATRDFDVGAAAVGGAFACTVVGFVALATSGPVGPLPLAVLAIALVVGAWRLRRGAGVNRASQAATLRTGLGLFLVALVVVPLHAVASGSWLLGGVDLLVLLLANRLFALRNEGAQTVVGHVLLLSLLMLMAAAVLTINFGFLGSVFLFCVAGTWTAMFRALWDPKARGADARVPRTVAGVAIGAGVALFALTCGLFALLPRIQFQAFETGFLQVQGMSGFSEEVELGALGAVQLDRSPVMRVALSGREIDESRLYWRGMSLDRYEGGGRWRVGNPEETELRGRPLFGSSKQRYIVEPAVEDEPVVQDITFEPLDVSVIFGLANMQRIDGEMRLLTRNTTDSIFYRAARFGRMRYQVYSDVRAPDSAQVRDEAVASVPAQYLEISPELKAAIEPLAREMAGEGSPWRMARRIETTLQTWDYSLESVAGTRPDPLEAFLLETRTGWCEQYSASMVMLLRALGVPARMTNGFSGGEKNEFGQYWLVRNSDAHSWVEVPFEKSGWVIFDPTPGQGPSRPEFGGWLRRGFDYIRLLWTQRVVEYDLIDQFQILRVASKQAEAFGDRVSGVFRSGAAAAGWMSAALALAAMATVAALRYRARTRLPADPGLRAAAEARRWWTLVERRFRRDGIIRRAGETPRELAIRAGQPAWADLYYVARFGMRTLSEDERAAIARLRASL